MKHDIKKNIKKSAGDLKHFTKEFLLNSLSAPIFVYHHIQKRFVYANQDFADLLNCPIEECYHKRASDFNSIIEPNDLEMLRTVIKDKLFEQLNKLVHKKIFRLSYTVNYRIRVNKMYEQVLQQITAVEWDKDKYPIVTFNMLTNITNRQKENKLVLTINVFDEKKQYWKNVLSQDFLRRPPMLTERECEIMYMMLMGFSATQIAKRLFISFYTARAHMRNILNKTNSKTQQELQQLAAKQGWA